jgi:phosphotransferase system enzyme I (PtsI)
MTDRPSSTPPGATRPPPSDTSTPHGVVLKGIAGSPGVAVGPALVVGDTKAAYARRHVASAQIDAEVLRLRTAVEDAKRHIREVSAKLPKAPLETNAILDAYLTMIGDPMLIERVERKIRDEKKCAEWAVAQAGDEIG